jgi:hypothetical protein
LKIKTDQDLFKASPSENTAPFQLRRASLTQFTTPSERKSRTYP